LPDTYLERAEQEELRRLYRSVIFSLRAEKAGNEIVGEIHYRLSGEAEGILSL
jgi:hypothetical protein